MLDKRRELYRSPNGDIWYLCRDDSGRIYVQHVPNLASGGTRSETDVCSFLSRGGQGPEHQQLLQLIGTLVDARSDEQSPVD